MSKLERLVVLVREWDHYCIRVDTALDGDKAQNMATFMPKYDEHREWSLEIKGEFKPMERPN